MKNILCFMILSILPVFVFAEPVKFVFAETIIIVSVETELESMTYFEMRSMFLGLTHSIRGQIYRIVLYNNKLAFYDFMDYLEIEPVTFGFGWKRQFFSGRISQLPKRVSGNSCDLLTLMQKKHQHQHLSYLPTKGNGCKHLFQRIQIQ